MKFTPETLREVCEEFRIRGKNQDKLVNDFFENYPDLELVEDRHDCYVRDNCIEKWASYSFGNNTVLNFNAPTTTSDKQDGLCVDTRPSSVALFWGVASGCFFYETGRCDPLMHGGTGITVAHDNKSKKQWCERVKNFFTHTRS